MLNNYVTYNFPLAYTFDKMFDLLSIFNFNGTPDFMKYIYIYIYILDQFHKHSPVSLYEGCDLRNYMDNYVKAAQD